MNSTEMPMHAAKQKVVHGLCHTLEETFIRSFIADTFARHHNAKLESFCDHLVGVCAQSGELLAAAGYNLAEDGPLFLEQYLDVPIQQHVLNTLGFEIQRHEVAEVGNLAALQAGGARLLIEMMTKHLHAEGRRWVAFTATQSLINSFHRMGLSPVVLAPALPHRVKNAAAWGTYYQNHPQVVLGDIQLGNQRLGACQ